MSVTYEVIPLDFAKEGDLPYHSDWEDDSDRYEYGQGIWRCVDGKPVEFIGEDGGEPEDQTLRRDWSWVAGELTRAFELGRTYDRVELRAGT